MANIKIYLSEKEHKFAKGQGSGYIRGLIRKDMDQNVFEGTNEKITKEQVVRAVRKSNEDQRKIMEEVRSDLKKCPKCGSLYTGKCLSKKCQGK